MHTENIEYKDGDTILEGYLAYDESTSGKRPAVLVCHAWGGRDEFACKKAEMLAELGYVGFALDMFGKGMLGSGPDENSKLIHPFVSDRQFLKQRLFAGLNTLRGMQQVDTSKVGAIGFCFGGLCVLDLARSGEPVSGVVSFHGLLNAPDPHPAQDIQAKVLALHGYDDPMAQPDALLEFASEMTKCKADWQVHAYGNTMHAFTNPVANDPGFGTVYSPAAEQRSLQSMRNFFQEIF